MPYRAKVGPDTGTLLDGTRVCAKCQVRQSMTEFAWLGKARKYRTHSCRTCGRAKYEAKGKYWTVTKASVDPRYLAKKYGITIAAFNSMWETQHAECAICHRNLDDGCQVDHDHSTGAVRGLLCFPCNSGLGKFKDDASYLRAAADYLEQDPPQLEKAIVLTAEEERARRSEWVKRGWETRRNSVQ